LEIAVFQTGVDVEDSQIESRRIGCHQRRLGIHLGSRGLCSQKAEEPGEADDNDGICAEFHEIPLGDTTFFF